MKVMFGIRTAATGLVEFETAPTESGFSEVCSPRQLLGDVSQAAGQYHGEGVVKARGKSGENVKVVQFVSRHDATPFPASNSRLVSIMSSATTCLNSQSRL